jgi:hypothetical protein
LLTYLVEKRDTVGVIEQMQELRRLGVQGDIRIVVGD